MLKLIPLTGLVLLIYWLLSTNGFFPTNLERTFLRMHLPSGAWWGLSYGAMMLILGLIALFIEILKSTRTSDTSIIDHMLSTFVLAAYISMWLIVPSAGNSYFLILTLMSMIDVLAGFTVTINGAKRGFGL